MIIWQIRPELPYKSPEEVPKVWLIDKHYVYITQKALQGKPGYWIARDDGWKYLWCPLFHSQTLTMLQEIRNLCEMFPDNFLFVACDNAPSPHQGSLCREPSSITYNSNFDG